MNVAFITKFIKKFNFYPISGKGTGLRQPVHAFDLAKASYDIINNETTYNKVYTLNSGETIEYSVMVEKIFASLKKKKLLFESQPLCFIF